MGVKKIGGMVCAGIIAVMGASLISGCEQINNLRSSARVKSWKAQGAVIASVDGLPITIEQLEEEIMSYNEMAENADLRIKTREQKIAYLNDEIVRRYLLYIEAKKKGMDKEAKTQEILKNLEVNILAGQLLRGELEKTAVSEAEIEEFYNTYKEQYRQEEERKIREIVLDNESEAKEILIELLKGGDFAGLAVQRSKGASAQAGGDLGYIKRGKRGADYVRFDEIAFSRSIEAGQISAVFKEKAGYYIIKVDAIKGGQMKSLFEVREDIKKVVQYVKQQQKLKELTADLIKKAKVTINQELIK